MPAMLQRGITMHRTVLWSLFPMTRQPLLASTFHAGRLSQFGHSA